MRKLQLLNQTLMILVLLLVFVAVADFLYVLLKHYSTNPALTGTASDIVIAATNSALVCIAIAAYRKFFKERIYEKAVDKIDNLLMNLDLAISEIEGVYIELITLNAYHSNGDFVSDVYGRYLAEYKEKIQKGIASSYLANSNAATLNRWRVKYKVENMEKLEYSIQECLELYMMQTTIYIVLTDCVSEANGQKKIMPELDFKNLFFQFQKRRADLIENYNKIKNIPADELFTLY
ncbi:TPA: hypothetical protein PRY88_004284 [Escherichia coli]|nr:hypothetical protein [Escherichia coli]HAI3444717.1 hypothetical protein [Escherichia coli]HCN1740399.1 hypothetical protein [Escherichia coli]HCN3841447.1 hypothetical protein [Escherichia coli]HDK2755693.1 hypothetical protein [Escherichia coli]